MGRGTRRRSGRGEVESAGSIPPARLHKLLSQAGVASRRSAEKMIDDGRVTVDGRVVRRQGLVVDPSRCEVRVDGRTVPLRSAPIYLLLHKPRGTVCTSHDPQGRERVFDLIRGRLPRIWTIGRLDFQTSGALLITNDGALTEALTHPRHRVERAYEVKLRDELSPEALIALADGVALDDGFPVEPLRPELLSGARRAWWYGVVLHEGHNREVRRVFDAVGAQLQKLHRSSFAGLTLAGVRPGRYRYLGQEEVDALYAIVGLDDAPEVVRRRSQSRRAGAGPKRRSRPPLGSGKHA